MKRRYLLALVFALAFRTVFAHEDFTLGENFGNVKVEIITGFEYEEINKVLLFGQLAEKFAKQLKYSKPIFLDFKHHYTRDDGPAYFISYGTGKVWDATAKKARLIEDSIVISQFARQFDAQVTLKLLEYAILNANSIKSSQKEITHKDRYRERTLDSIDTALIEKALNEPNSAQVKKALGLKFERPVEYFSPRFSYYLQDNKYTVFLREDKEDTSLITLFSRRNKKDTNLITLDNIYDFQQVTEYANGHSVVIFDTDSSFYFIDECGDKISKRHIMQNMEGCRPFNVAYIANQMLAISCQFLGRGHGDRTLLYLIGDDVLIQDLDKLIRKKE